MRRLLRGDRPTFAYIILFVFVCFAVFRLEANTRTDQQRARNLCHVAQRGWDQLDKLDQILTEPAKLSPTLATSTDSAVAALRTQIAQGNARKLDQRSQFVAQQGERPTC